MVASYGSLVKIELGATLTTLGRPQEAEAILTDALENLRAQQGETHETTKLAESRLSDAKALLE